MKLLFCVCLMMCVFASQAKLSQGESCDTDSDCSKQECCDLSEFIVTKRQAGDAARFPISSLRGTCRPLAQEGESCSGFGCGCARGLQCVRVYPLMVTRDVAALPPDDFGGIFAPFPYSVCRRHSAGPKCYSNDDCEKGQCCSFSFGAFPGDVLIKRILLSHPTSGTCQDFGNIGDPCNRPCGCDPELICSSDISSWRLDSNINSTLIASLPDICVEPVFTIS